jgi:hypothetical protein
MPAERQEIVLMEKKGADAGGAIRSSRPEQAENRAALISRGATEVTETTN